MIDGLAFLGEPKKFKGKINIFPPKVKDVFKEEAYSQYVRLLTVSQYDIYDELMEKNGAEAAKDAPTPFTYLLINCYYSPQFAELAKKAFYFFLHQEVNFFYEQKLIVIGKLEEEVKRVSSVEELLTIGEENFFDFQNIIREVCGDSPKPQEVIDPNENPRISEMKAKARARDRAKEKQNAKKGTSFSDMLPALCLIGAGITPLNVGEISYAAAKILTSTYQRKEKYDLDIRSLLAGADPKKVKPKYWVDNSNDD